MKLPKPIDPFYPDSTIHKIGSHEMSISINSIDCAGDLILQGCSDYSLSDLRTIASTKDKDVGCSTLGGQRAVSCRTDHNNVKAYCSSNDCGGKKKCLDARIKTMAHFDATIKELQNCQKNAWKRANQDFKKAATEAAQKLAVGKSGHQTQIDLVSNWIKSHC